MSTKNIDARMSMFGRLAMESGLVTHDEIVSCIEEQENMRADGLTPPRLGELLIEKNILTQDEVDTILRMQSNPGGLIGRQLVENNLVTREQLREVLDEQSEMTRAGQTPPRIGELLVQKGLIKQDDLRLLLRKKEAPGSLFGEFLVSNRLVSEDDINKCLLIQKDVTDKGEKSPRLGEVLVQCGILRKEQVELYSQRHMQGRKNIAAAVAPAGLAAKRTNSKVVRGDLIIMETLGQHIDGITYKALHAPSGAVMAAHFFSDPEPEGPGGQAFERKCEQATKIFHPAIQPLFSNESYNGRKVLVAEFIEGSTLDQTIGDAGKIEWTWALEIACDLVEVLLQASKLGITHDDIRPGSILVDYAGKARLGLWAYTRDPLANREWLAKRYKTLSFYQAPERLRTAADARSDMFSLGLTLIHAITGKSILRGGSLAEALKSSAPSDAMQNLAIDLTLPLGFVSILARMVEADKNNRFPDHGELLRALRTFREEQGLDENPGGATGLLESRSMSLDQATQVISQFLETEIAVIGERKVSMFRLLKFYVAPIVAMLAIMLLTTAVYRETQASQGLMVRANWRDQQGDKAGALSLYRIISTLYPDNEKVQQRYYDLALENKDHGEAEIALERLMTLHPQDRLGYLELQADLQVWQKRFLSAVDLYRQVLASRPYDMAIRTKMAEALLWAQSYPEAEKEFSELVRLDPHNNTLALGLARSAAGNKNVETASRMFAQLNRNSLLPEDSFMEYAWLLKDGGRDDELRALAQGALRRKETDDYSRRNMVYLHYWAGDYSEALRALNRLADVTSNDRDFLLLRVTINSDVGNTDAVIEDYTRLAQLEPNNPEYTTTIAQIYQGRGDFENADAFYRQSLARGGDQPELKMAIARNLSFMGNYEEAVKWYRDVLGQSPNDKDAIQGIVQTLLWGDRYEEAQQYAERLYRENPRNRDNRVNLALVYSRLGKTEEAGPIIDGLVTEGLLSREELENLAINAMSANANDLLLRLISAEEGDSAKLTELRLILARRMRAEGRHTTALPLYAAVLASTPKPDTALLMEMAETANWAGRHDIAAIWLEMARDITAGQKGSYPAAAATRPQPGRFRLSANEWDSLLDPLRQNPDVYGALSGFQKRFSWDPPAQGGAGKL